MSPSPDRIPAAAHRGDLRASHADRDQAVGSLKAAFVEGRLVKEEFDQRVGQALTSRTYAELAAVTADLPAGLTAAEPPAPARPAGKRPVLLRPGAVGATATLLYLGMWPLAAALPRTTDSDVNDVVNLVGGATLVYMFVVVCVCVWAQVLASRRGESPGERAGPAATRMPSPMGVRAPRTPA